MRTTVQPPFPSKTGHLLSRVLWRLLNRHRPVAGEPVTLYRGSALKGLQRIR